MKHRKDAKECLERAKDIMKEAEVVGEMPVTEWLDRQNLVKYLPMFTKHRIYSVKQIKHYVDDSGGFNSSFDFKNIQDQMRLGLMVRNDPNAKEDFEYQTK